MENLVRKAFCLVVLSLALGTSLAAFAEDVPKKLIAVMTPEERMMLTSRLQEIVNATVSSREYFVDDREQMHVVVVLDPSTNLVVLDFDERFGPESNCTSEKGCESFQKSVYNLDGLAKYKVGYLCKRQDLDKPPIEITVRAKDFDGVVSKPAIYKVQCARPTTARK